MQPEELKALIELMNENDLLELEVVEEGKKIRLKKMYEGGAKIVPMPMGGGVPPAPATAPDVAPTSAATSAPAPADATGHLIKSPMVGTFYRSPNPESPPYVDVGDEIGPDSVVCILEAMKVFNEIKAECEGKVVEILVENGEAVEYGQPLYRVELS